MEIEALLQILACPACRGSLTYEDKNGGGFLCARCQTGYPVEEDNPIMLIDRAIPLSKWRDAEKS